MTKKDKSVNQTDKKEQAFGTSFERAQMTKTKNKKHTTDKVFKAAVKNMLKGNKP